MYRLQRLRLPAGLIALVGLILISVACGDQTLETTNARTSSRASVTFQEDFIPGKTGNWEFEKDDAGSTEVVNDQLVITVNSPNTIQFAKLNDPAFSDFVLEVDLWQRSGSSESSFGVLFRMQDNQQFYRFEVTGTGLFVIERRDADGTWTRLIPEWTPTPALNKGLNVPNRLKIIAAGSDMTFYVNDILLTQVKDDRYTSGMIGLDAGTFSGGSVQVSFDNLAVTSGTP